MGLLVFDSLSLDIFSRVISNSVPLLPQISPLETFILYYKKDIVSGLISWNKWLENWIKYIIQLFLEVAYRQNMSMIPEKKDGKKKKINPTVAIFSLLCRDKKLRQSMSITMSQWMRDWNLGGLIWLYLGQISRS